MKKSKSVKPKILGTTVNFKLPKSILFKIQSNAEKFTDGNLSAWLRSAGLNYIPVKPKNETIPDFF